MQSLQLLISTLKQAQMVCIFNAVTTGHIIKLVILIHLVKTNQLPTVFQSTKRIKRKYFAKANEVAVPGIFITVNTCAKSVQTRRFLWRIYPNGDFSGPYFPVFGLNTEIYSVQIWVKYRLEKTLYLESFQAVNTLPNIIHLVGTTFNFDVFEKKQNFLKTSPTNFTWPILEYLVPFVFKILPDDIIFLN